MDWILFCAGLLAFAVLMYAILDGFSLGQGILFMWAPSDYDRDVMMTSIAPFWDGNATWLIYGGAILFGAFPTAYAILSHALYIPINAMVVTLLFRGVAFEFRHKAERSRWIWDISFWAGSTLTAFWQGTILGAAIEGFAVEDQRFVGGTFDWSTTFSMLTGFSVIAAYALLGSTWLIMKTSKGTRRWAQSITVPLILLVSFFILVVSLRTPYRYPMIAQRWFSYPTLIYLSPIPILTILAIYKIMKGIKSHDHTQSFRYTVILYILCFIGLGVSLWPHIVMPYMTIWDAAAAPSAIHFMSVVSVISLPIILGYSIFVYRVFKGKTTASTIYG
jgi:cytochrome d ubiquinol oxidase subunit II